jgi:hypothetical protein
MSNAAAPMEREMSYSTIYDMGSGYTLADGVQSQRDSDATINLAKRLASKRRRSVIVEDRGTRECYRVSPAGHIWKAPKTWAPEWEFLGNQ